MLDVAAAAALVSRTPETVRRWVWSGRLPAQRQGRRLMVARDDVLRLTGGSQQVTRPSLREWAATVRESAEGDRAMTASDLVADDRADRSGERSDAGR